MSQSVCNIVSSCLSLCCPFKQQFVTSLTSNNRIVLSKLRLRASDDSSVARVVSARARRDATSLTSDDRIVSSELRSRASDTHVWRRDHGVGITAACAPKCACNVASSCLFLCRSNRQQRKRDNCESDVAHHCCMRHRDLPQLNRTCARAKRASEREGERHSPSPPQQKNKGKRS